MVGKEVLCALANFRLILAKSAEFLISDLINSLIVVSKISMDKKYAEYLLNKTKEDYNFIADDFSRTRDYLAERMKSLGKYVKDGDKILDLGCGNGILVELFFKKNINYTGVDNSEKLIGIAKKNYPGQEFLVASALNIPFPEGCFDKVFCLAVFHHIPSEELRLQVLREIRRVLKPGGQLVLTVWNLNPFRSILIGKGKRALDFFKHYFLRIFRRTKLDFNDFFVLWKNDCRRYVHYFSKGALGKLAREAGFKIKETGISKTGKTKESNIFLLAEK